MMQEMKKLWDEDLRRVVKLKKQVKELEALLQERGDAGTSHDSALDSSRATTREPGVPPVVLGAVPSPPRQPRKQKVRTSSSHSGPCLVCAMHVHNVLF